MRVTNSMLIGNFMSNLNGNLKRMEVYQNQLASGKKITRPSQDPVGITRSLQARSQLSKVSKYQQNVGDAQAWLTQTETTLMEINSVLARAYELANDAANGTKTQEDRQAIAKEIEQLKLQLVEAGNSNYAGRYIFGGYNTTQRPFEVDANGKLIYNSFDVDTMKDPASLSALPASDQNVINGLSNEIIRYEINDGIFMDINFTGLNLFGIKPGAQGEDLFNVIRDFEIALNNDDQAAIFTAIGSLQKQQENILSHLAEVGGKTNRLELIAKRLQDDEYNYMGVKSMVEDVDQEKVTMEFKMAEAVYRSSLAIGARIIQPTLVDFLR